MRRGEVVHRRLHAALLVRDAGQGQRHLGDAERADQRAVVDVAEVADAEILAAVLAEARAVRDVEMVERQRAELVGVACAAVLLRFSKPQALTARRVASPSR